MNKMKNIVQGKKATINERIVKTLPKKKTTINERIVKTLPRRKICLKDPARKPKIKQVI